MVTVVMVGDEATPIRVNSVGLTPVTVTGLFSVTMIRERDGSVGCSIARMLITVMGSTLNVTVSGDDPRLDFCCASCATSAGIVITV